VKKQHGNNTFKWQNFLEEMVKEVKAEVLCINGLYIGNLFLKNGIIEMNF
jgi:hypothetical protein